MIRIARRQRARLTLGLAFGLWALTFLCAARAMAGTPVVLKMDTTAAGASVTLGDLFDGAGPAASIPVARAAQPGLTVVLDAAQVQRQAHIQGLDWDNPNGVRRIVVTSTAGGAAPAGKVGGVLALTLTRSLATGEVIAADDLAWTKVIAAPADAPRDADLVIGMAAKRPLREGMALGARDLSAPVVIHRDDVVQVDWKAPGISLSLQGKAMGPAAAGQPVSVMNPASKKVVEAVATGPGRAVAGPEADQARGPSSAQFASLR